MNRLNVGGQEGRDDKISSDPFYIDEYGFGDFGVGDPAIPSRYLFGDDYSETIPGGDVEPEYWKTLGNGYWLSNLGHVYSEKTDRMLSVAHNVNKKYPGLRLSLGDANHTKLFTLHRLLAENFIPNTHNDPVVRHLNDDPDDYDLENLAWGTYKDNYQDAINNGANDPLTPEAIEKGSNARKKPIKITDVRTGDERYYSSLHDAARQTGYDPAYICNWLKGKWKNPNWKLEYL